MTDSPQKLQKRVESSSLYINGSNSLNPWSPDEVDKLESNDKDGFRQVIESCRFFYKKDPIASSVINKLVDIGITPFRFKKNGTPDNEMRVYQAMVNNMHEFAECMALEFLISGLVVPEIKFAPATKDFLKENGIKKYETLDLPVNMWIRDPATMVINSSIIGGMPSYYVEIPDDFIYFINHKGRYKDGTEDTDLYNKIVAYYPSFIEEINNNNIKMVRIDNPYIIRRRSLSNNPYPIPYLSPSIDDMRHKRNLRRMDYSVASRVISAIMLVKLGDKDFPLLDGEEGYEQLQSIKQQMLWRDGSNKNVEKVFQLFGNHTLNIEWIYPPVDALLSDAKYKEVNEDILIALGVPRILLTGESEKSNTSDPQYATISPIETMNSFREKILHVIQRGIIDEIARQNDFKTTPTIVFKPLQLAELQLFMNGLFQLYTAGNLSRKSLDEFFGYEFDDEIDQRTLEEKDIEGRGVPSIAPMPYSAAPQQAKPGNPGGSKVTTKPEITPKK
jgi:hypothetical protein